MDKWAELGERRRAAFSRASSPGETSQAICSGPSETSLPSHPMILKNSWENYIHGLSQVEYHHKSGRDLPASRATQSDREHVASLDGLALLLVFSPKGDVTAVSYWQLVDELKVLWAKNQSVDNSNELRYIEELLENVKNGTPARKLLNIVIPMCRDKIFHRVKKLANSFGVSQTDQRLGESNLWRFDEAKEPCQKLEATLKKAKWLEGYKSIVHLLDSFTRFLGKVTRTSKVEDFRTILYLLWSITSVAGLKSFLEEKQVGYLNKLSDYVRILERLHLIIKKIGTKKITIEQVRPPAAESIEVLSGSLDVLNLRSPHIFADDGLDWDLVTGVYKKAQPGRPAVGKKEVNFTQHCEITLALHMLERTRLKLTKSKIEIGVSKACCEWCCKYLSILASAYPRHPVLVRASHGKQPDGWMMPPDGPKSLEQRMAQSIEEKLDDVVWEIKSRRRSDSNELPAFTREADVEDDGQDFAENRVYFG